MGTDGQREMMPPLQGGGWKKTLSWRDGLIMMLPLLSGAFVSSGFMVGALGTWGALLISLIMGVVALLTNFLLAEMAAMFPERTGGISMYIHQGLRRYFLPGSVLGSFGYWLGYSLSIGFGGIQFGALLKMQWFSDQNWTVSFVGGTELGLQHFIGVGLLLVCWLLTVLGVRLVARISLIVGCFTLFFVLTAIIGPVVKGDIDLSNLTFHLGGWRSTVVWLYIAGWSLFASELGAVFAPEYRDARRDVPRVLLLSSVFVMFAFGFTPWVSSATVGEQTVFENALAYGPLVAAQVFGGGQQFFSIVFAASSAVGVLVFMNDCGRATAGMAEEGTTIRQLGHLNRFGAPGWGTHVVAVMNICTVLFIADPVGIILASNLGYLLAHSLANWSFVILRKSQPDLPRPYKLQGAAWMPIAVLLGVFHIFILVIGAASPGQAGYGGLKETLIAAGIMCIGLVLWVVRVVVQDRKPLRLRDARPIPLRGVTVADSATGICAPEMQRHIHNSGG